MPRTMTPELLALRLVQAFVAAILALSIFLALVVPYHTTDALVYGHLSQVIGRDGGFLHDQIGYPAYSRPLFLVPQGWLWWVFGAHEWIGRLFSLAFFALLLWAVWRLASELGRSPLTGWLAVLALLALPDAVVQAFAGQTDVPVAAVLALAGVLALCGPPSTRRALLLVAVAAAAVLAKATALPALAGLAAACLLGDRAGLRTRVLHGALPIAGGTALGLVYGLAMARHYGMALNSFLGGAVSTEPAPPVESAAPPAAGGAPADPGAAAGTTPPPDAPVNDVGVLERVGNGLRDFFSSTRDEILLRGEWFGPYVRLVLIVAVVYAVARIVRASHRAGLVAALVVGLGWYLAGPEGSVLDAGAGAVLGSLLALGVLTAAAWCPEERRPSALTLARLLVWGIPPLLAWGVFGILGDTRTLSPAWPPLIVLVALVFAMGVDGLRQRVAWAWAPALAVVVMLGFAVLDFRNFDGLGSRPDGSINSLRAFRELTPATWTDPTQARIAADPQLGGLVADLRAARPPGGRVWTNDGRMGFYFLEDVDVAQPPSSCRELEGYAVLGVLLNVPEPFDPSRLPCLEPVREVPGSYAVYRVTPA